MFSQTWKKYLPVITILIKRSANGDQTMRLNNTDFERAAGGRKIKFSFTQLQINKGRINTQIKQTPVAKELATLMQEDLVVKKLLADQWLEFSLSNDFTFTIKNNAPVVEATNEAEEEAVLDKATAE
jgi:hypothetical protein